MSRGAPVGAYAEQVQAALIDGGETVARAMMAALGREDKVEAERAARGLKKIAEARPEALLGLRRELLRAATRAEDIRVQWNLTIVLGRLPLRGREKAAAVDLMFERLRDQSGLNRTFALQALWDYSEQDAALRRRVLPVALEFLENGTPAMQARARRLLNPGSAAKKS